MNTQYRFPLKIPIPFGALKNTQAQKLAAGLQEIQTKLDRQFAVTFHGQWDCGRFIIAELVESAQYTPKPIRDLERGTLTMPILPASDWETYIHQLRGFGMQVEHAERKMRKGQFEIVDGPDGNVHRIEKGRHIACCGYRGPWTKYVRDPSTSITCSACEKSIVDG